MDLDSIIPQDSIEVELLHPKTQAPLGAFVTLAGPSHPGVTIATREILDRTRGKKKTTSEQDERDGMDLLCARVLDWRGIVRGENPIPYSKDNAKELLADQKNFWIRVQLMEALDDQARFFKK